MIDILSAFSLIPCTLVNEARMVIVKELPCPNTFQVVATIVVMSGLLVVAI